MTTPTPELPPSSPDAPPAVPDEYQCQNKDGRAWAVAIMRPGISECDFLCEVCNITMWLAVAKQMHDNGDLPME
jgi:hypothetical protein